MGNVYLFPYTLKEKFSFCYQIYTASVCVKHACSLSLGMCCLMSLFFKVFLIIRSQGTSTILFRKKIAYCRQSHCWICCCFFPIQLVIHTQQGRRIPRLSVTSLNISSCFPIWLKFNQGIIHLPA